MQTTNSRSTKSKLTKYNFQISKIALLLALSISVGCSVTSKHETAMREVLNVQDELLDQLKLERDSKEVIDKITADKDLSEAESRLKEAIAVLKESNATLRSALSKSKQ